MQKSSKLCHGSDPRRFRDFGCRNSHFTFACAVRLACLALILSMVRAGQVFAQDQSTALPTISSFNAGLPLPPPELIVHKIKIAQVDPALLNTATQSMSDDPSTLTPTSHEEFLGYTGESKLEFLNSQYTLAFLYYQGRIFFCSWPSTEVGHEGELSCVEDI